MSDNKPNILLTGATGYVEGRLLKTLNQQGYPVRCLVKNPNYLNLADSSNIQIIKGDIFDLESLEKAMFNVNITYYLVHSMRTKGSFVEEDQLGAKNFGKAAKKNGIERIIYLGGLGKEKIFPITY